MYKICVYTPQSHAEVVKSALFKAGAGRIGDYDCCCWQTLGTGQFRALEGSEPFIGVQGKIESVPEYRIELVCADEIVHEAVRRMIQAHPYEEPAYDVWRLEEL